jgi:hypothetical protein
LSLAPCKPDKSNMQGRNHLEAARGRRCATITGIEHTEDSPASWACAQDDTQNSNSFVANCHVHYAAEEKLFGIPHAFVTPFATRLLPATVARGEAPGLRFLYPVQHYQIRPWRPRGRYCRPNIESARLSPRSNSPANENGRLFPLTYTNMILPRCSPLRP